MIQLLYKAADVPDLHMPTYILVTAEAARHHGAHCTVIDGMAEQICKDAYDTNKLLPPFTAHVQILGFVDLTLKLWRRGCNVQWRYPESGLHPKCQLILGDIMVALERQKGVLDAETLRPSPR